MALLFEKKLTSDLQTKVEQLKKYFANKIVIVAYSGGVDSTVLAELGHQFAKRMIAVTADSITVLPGEVQEATQIALHRGWEHQIIHISELKDDNFAANPSNRCYYCKKGLSEELHKIALEVNANVIVEGTNISEAGGHRPGLKALNEGSIDSPLLINKLTKTDIRELARFLNLSNAEKPSLACLSSRFPYGVRITPENLKRVGLAERYIRDNYHVKVLRVRDHDGLARIEVAPEERVKLLKIEVLDSLQHKLREFGFTYVSLDCRGYRTGALNEVFPNEEDPK
ncbi:MAG: ATP-dependent sacrificial sulfur transferase LarE [Candidatus Hodarchaeales archaeon]|jgi:uncharacterized protein